MISLALGFVAIWGVPLFIATTVHVTARRDPEDPEITIITFGLHWPWRRGQL